MTMPINRESLRGEAGRGIALVGLGIYVLFAPHSVAASAIGAGIASLGWLIRTLQTRSLGLRWSKFDLLILLSLLWTVASALLSEEPRTSVAKLKASWCVLLFYLARATLTRKSAVALVVLLILSGSAGALYSGVDLLRGRGVVVESIAPGSLIRLSDRVTRSGRSIASGSIRPKMSIGYCFRRRRTRRSRPASSRRENRLSVL
jgi:hypothetical protein